MKRRAEIKHENIQKCQLGGNWITGISRQSYAIRNGLIIPAGARPANAGTMQGSGAPGGGAECVSANGADKRRMIHSGIAGALSGGRGGKGSAAAVSTGKRVAACVASRTSARELGRRKGSALSGEGADARRGGRGTGDAGRRNAGGAAMYRGAARGHGIRSRPQGHGSTGH